MTKEEFKELEDALVSMQSNTTIVATDISLLIRKFDENRKQIIMTVIEDMKVKLNFIETEVNLINEKKLIKA